MSGHRSESGRVLSDWRRVDTSQVVEYLRSYSSHARLPTPRVAKQALRLGAGDSDASCENLDGERGTFKTATGPCRFTEVPSGVGANGAPDFFIQGRKLGTGNVVVELENGHDAVDCYLPGMWGGIRAAVVVNVIDHAQKEPLKDHFSEPVQLWRRTLQGLRGFHAPTDCLTLGREGICRDPGELAPAAFELPVESLAFRTDTHLRQLTAKMESQGGSINRR
ncbi:hypothetical protein FN846DRAFT_902373 [Sphaerosporella brunnea]|uniref:Uncharacterized protein n=1 Tax=Sphaerosporella brunnea TaxID=1250544 RepID=A0A5J5FAI3_9PEZI|nr:hypothetical protein FN846DRAFT_902373 [Sphaerosporella brunnea]